MNNSNPPDIADSFRKLKSAATDLNTASDGLTTVVAEFEAILKQLNLGVPAWVTLSRESDDYGTYEVELGYTRIGSKWGVALRTTDADRSRPEEPTVNQWLFNDAPRQLRLEAIEGLPKLIAALITVAQATAERIQSKSRQATELLAAMTARPTSSAPQGAPPSQPPAILRTGSSRAPIAPRLNRGAK